jgi:hypothetical protein
MCFFYTEEAASDNVIELRPLPLNMYTSPLALWRLLWFTPTPSFQPPHIFNSALFSKRSKQVKKKEKKEMAM